MNPNPRAVAAVTVRCQQIGKFPISSRANAKNPGTPVSRCLPGTTSSPAGNPPIRAPLSVTVPPRRAVVHISTQARTWSRFA